MENQIESFDPSESCPTASIFKCLGQGHFSVNWRVDFCYGFIYPIAKCHNLFRWTWSFQKGKGEIQK